MREEAVKYHAARLPELVAMADQIRQMYDTRHSIATVGISTKAQPGTLSPVEKALHAIDAQRDHLAEQMAQYFREEEEITQWLEALPDPIMKTIIRAHFLTGKSWAETALIVYGRGSSADSVRVYYRRHKAEIYES